MGWILGFGIGFVGDYDLDGIRFGYLVVLVFESQNTSTMNTVTI
jgi:hypothetical protein